jgi:hypothetical protein
VTKSTDRCDTHDGPATKLYEASAAAAIAACAALVRGDADAVRRRRRLAADLEHEADYERNVHRGYPVVRRRTDAPDFATIGWYFRNDAVTRVERRRLGVTLP